MPLHPGGRGGGGSLPGTAGMRAAAKESRVRVLSWFWAEFVFFGYDRRAERLGGMSAEEGTQHNACTVE
ncbi:hypothetical protein ColLi_02689 [Colletotrichum liriopes]|uniref:Uncharacterized protein n=1 Tax=Colletotrichum liriopes TaxID=708192 RepID=A0AA37GG87_9PEZI|nr:hypothetical protein ColLi_02689 [Colletotrichum liriopes]